MENPPAGDAAAGRKIAPKDAFTTSGNFLGARLFDANAVPPDSMGAVGPVQFIVAVNGRIRSFNKTSATADGEGGGSHSLHVLPAGCPFS